MMELNSNLIDVIQYVELKPYVMVVWSTLGVCILIFLLLIPMYILQKLGIKNFFTLLIGATFISLVMGFITQIFFLLTDVSGLKMLLIWGVMFCINLVFVFTHQKYILKWASIKEELL